MDVYRVDVRVAGVVQHGRWGRECGVRTCQAGGVSQCVWGSEGVVECEEGLVVSFPIFVVWWVEEESANDV